MTHYYTLTDVFKYKKPGEFSFALEKNSTSSKRIFYVGAHLDLITTFEYTIDKRFHEIIFDDVPIKAFLDLESCVLTKELFDEEVKRVLNLLKDLGDFVSFTSSREEKQSMHVIFWNSVFSNVYALKKYIASKVNSPIIDMQVYKAGSLRLPWCTSFRSFPYVLLPISFEQSYDRELFKKALLHYYETSGVYEQVTKQHNKPTPQFVSTKTYDEPLFNWAQENKCLVVSYREDPSKIQMLLRGLKCPKKGEVHKSNNFAVSIDLTLSKMPSFFICLDEECKDVKFNGPLFSTIINKKEMTDILLSI